MSTVIWQGRNYHVDPEEAAAELQRIQLERGKLTPDVVLEEASHEGSLFHDLFLWDDSEAAHRYRLTQARQLVRSLRVVIREGDPSEPLLISVRRESSSTEHDRVYVPFAATRSDEDIRREYLFAELARLESLIPRTEAFGEFTPLREAVAEIRRNLHAGADVTADGFRVVAA